MQVLCVLLSLYQSDLHGVQHYLCDCHTQFSQSSNFSAFYWITVSSQHASPRQPFFIAKPGLLDSCTQLFLAFTCAREWQMLLWVRQQANKCKEDNEELQICPVLSVLFLRCLLGSDLSKRKGQAGARSSLSAQTQCRCCGVQKEMSFMRGDSPICNSSVFSCFFVFKF